MWYVVCVGVWTEDRARRCKNVSVAFSVEVKACVRLKRLKDCKVRCDMAGGGGWKGGRPGKEEEYEKVRLEVGEEGDCGVE